MTDNLSNDDTRGVASALGGKVVSVPTKCISVVRNRRRAEATGEYLLFQDADNQISPDLLVEIQRQIATGRAAAAS